MSFFNDQWIDLRLNEMFVQQYLRTQLSWNTYINMKILFIVSVLLWKLGGKLKSPRVFEIYWCCHLNNTTAWVGWCVAYFDQPTVALNPIRRLKSSFSAFSHLLLSQTDKRRKRWKNNEKGGYQHLGASSEHWQTPKSWSAPGETWFILQSLLMGIQTSYVNNE